MMMRLSRPVMTAALLLGLAAAGAQAQGYPERDVTNVVVWAAGGGTDTLNRLIMAEMQDDLGVNINVTNRTGGVGGSAGMSFVYSQPADGYTLAGISESVVTAGVQGGWDERMDVWYPFIVGGSPDLISVPADSPHQSIEDLVEAAKQDPGSITAGASAAGSIHHLNLLAFGEGAGADFNFIPYEGSAPTQNAAIAGEVQMVVTSLAEQAQLIQAGRLRPLATLVPDSVEMEGVGTIPSAFDTYPELSNHLPIQQAIGFAVRSDAPEEVKEKLTSAFHAAMGSEAVQQWADQNYYTLSGLSGE
jgi:tripartite-type tricarboxylate transporter receptor subunit TctC